MFGVLRYAFNVKCLCGLRVYVVNVQRLAFFVSGYKRSKMYIMKITVKSLIGKINVVLLRHFKT